MHTVPRGLGFYKEATKGLQFPMLPFHLFLDALGIISLSTSHLYTAHLEIEPAVFLSQ